MGEGGWFYGKGALAHYYANVKHKNFTTLDTVCGRYTNGIGSEGLVPWIAGKRCGDCLQKAK